MHRRCLKLDDSDLIVFIHGGNRFADQRKRLSDQRVQQVIDIVDDLLWLCIINGIRIAVGKTGFFLGCDKIVYSTSTASSAVMS